MNIYAGGMSRMHRACPGCRFSTKDQGLDVCPHCQGTLLNLGKNFRPPRKTNRAQWKKIDLALATARIHHPNCYYSGKLSTRVKPAWCWSWCQCPSFKDFKTPADVKTGRGLRRSDRRNYARHHYRGEIPVIGP